MLYIHTTLINREMRRVTTLLFILSCFNLNSQHLRNYTSYTVDNGLAQNTVWDAFQDYKGFMWFGTADGVNRFDGYKMHHYKWNSKDSTTLLGNTSFRFYEDSKHNLWISHNKGVSIYNRTLDCFKNVIFEMAIANGNGESYTTILGEDPKGRVWSISGSQELLAINMNTFREEKRLKVTASKFSVSSIRTSIRIKDYIIGYLNDSLTTWFRINIQTDKVEIINGPHTFTGSFMKYNDSTICSLDKKNIYYYHVHSNRFEVKPLTSNEFSEKLNTLSSTSLTWWQGKIYFGSSSGLFIYNAETNEFEERITSFNKTERVGFYYIQKLRVDRTGNLWVCTNGDGVRCLSPYRNKFKHYNSSVSRTKLVKSITSDAAHNIYTGMYAEGIVTYKANGKSDQFKFGKLNDEHAHVLAQAFWNKRYFVVNDRYLKELNPITKKEISRTDVFHYKNKGYCAYPFFHCYNNKLYLSSDLSFYEIQPSGKGKLLFKFNNMDSIITCFTIVNDTAWWVGTTRFVCLFNPKTKQWKRPPFKAFIKTLCLSKDKKFVWVGAGVGLYLMDAIGNVLQKFEITDGLPDDFIYGILEDNQGRFWMSHNKGLSVYNPLTKTFKQYGVKDGLQSNEFNTGAYHKDNSGLLYFGGVNGVNVIDPSHVIENKNAPQVAINEILLGDIPYKRDTAYNEIQSLTLSYLENTLSFDFSALEFSQPESNIYQYKLTGYDKNWIQSGTKHFARYANLPPGNYVFQIMAANADGYWNKQPRNIFISIIPPFWQRTWFYLVMGLMGFVAIGGVFYAYIKRQQLKLQQELQVQQKLEKERLRISRDLHDNVGAQLSYLITNAEWMLQHPERLAEQDEQQRLQAMSEAGRNAILTLRQTIWAISNTSLKIDDFADRFKQFALKMLEFDKSVQVYFSEQILPNKELSPSVALNLFRVCQEAFNNCLKHAKSKNIHIHFQSDQQALFSFVIKDDGVGFDWEQAKQKGHYGLLNMEARAKETNAELVVASEINKGTTLTITLK
jgi:signal transduction histidine kinase/ligand-binding sensor domain-containing protein